MPGAHEEQQVQVHLGEEWNHLSTTEWEQQHICYNKKVTWRDIKSMAIRCSNYFYFSFYNMLKWIWKIFVENA